MSSRTISFKWWAALLLAALFFLGPLRAQEDDAESVAAAPDPARPPLPVLRSPVDAFRDLLVLSPEERKQAVATRPPAIQKRILAKVREYLAMKPDERELRLRATELRWYVIPLLSTPPTNRAAQMLFIPPELRQPISDRLAQWDKLPPAAQAELLENEWIERYFTQLVGSTGAQRTNLLADLSPERRARLEAGMARWSALSEEQRRKTCQRFDQFFDLTPGERERALKTLSDTERRQIEKTLRTFDKLTKTQREVCVQSFAKFASLSLAEREQFLKNAERWRLMSPGEREAWRDLVAMMPDWPPMPPYPPPPLPPLPPDVPRPAGPQRN